jgi:PleD family two-component response regulator
VLASIHRRERLRGLPIFLMLDRADAGTRRRAFESGADDYLLVPYVSAELARRVRARLEPRPASRGRRAALASQRKPASPLRSPAVTPAASKLLESTPPPDAE